MMPSLHEYENFVFLKQLILMMGKWKTMVMKFIMARKNSTGMMAGCVRMIHSSPRRSPTQARPAGHQTPSHTRREAEFRATESAGIDSRN